MKTFIEKLDWPLVIIFALGLGLAPFTPPHLYEKIILLWHGNLVTPLDWFDLVMHGSPWVLLFAKTVVSLSTKVSCKFVASKLTQPTPPYAKAF